MNNDLISKLSMLNLEKSYLIRELDNNCYDKVKRKKIFDKIKNVNKEIKNVKFKLELERKMKSGNNNTH